MSAVEALKLARAAGVRIAIAGDTLLLDAEAAPPAHVLNLLASHKAQIITLLCPGADGWSGEDWQTFYEERAAIREYDGGLSRPDAEAGALQDAIAHWLARHPLTPGVPEDGCMHCAGALPVDYRVAVLAGAGHAWLHPTCMQEMNEARLALAGREVRRLLGLSDPDE